MGSATRRFPVIHSRKPVRSADGHVPSDPPRATRGPRQRWQLCFREASPQRRIRGFRFREHWRSPPRFSLKNAVLRQVPWLRTHAWATCPDGVYRIAAKTLVAEKLFAASAVAARSLPDGEGRVWIVDAKGVSAWKDGVLVVRQETATAKLAPYLTAGRNGQLWMQTNSARNVFNGANPIQLPGRTRTLSATLRFQIALGANGDSPQAHHRIPNPESPPLCPRGATTRCTRYKSSWVEAFESWDSTSPTSFR
jgi:hypothetical protein